MTTGVIIGNGPSLNSVSNDWLRKYQTIGSNMIYLRHQFTPTFYTAIDSIGFKDDWNKKVSKMPCIKILGHKIKAQQMQNCIRIGVSIGYGFSCNLFHLPPYEGWSVTYLNLQLAFYLGWENVLLVGMDHRYTGKDDHFHPDYHPQGYEYKAYDMSKPEEYYRLAKYHYEQAGRRVINLTPNSALDVFEKDDIKNWKGQ